MVLSDLEEQRVSLRIGVIGCGFIAQYTYLPVIAQIGADRATVVAVFDTVEERVNVAREQFPDAVGYTNLDGFLAHPGGMDLVFNLTPAPLHRDLSARVLDAGASVYSEKPIASTVQHGIELDEIARERSLHLFCAPSTITTARMVWLKARIENGDFGHAHTIKAHIGGMGPAAWKEYTGDPRVFYSRQVGPLVDVGVYMLHTITGLFGPSVTVSAVGGITNPEREILVERFAGERVTVEAPDVYSINLTFGGNRFAHLFSSYDMPGSKAPMFELYGTQGAASIAGRQWYEGNGSTDFVFAPDGGHGAWENDVPTPNPLPIDGILESGILHALDVLKSGAENVLTAAHATHVLEIMLAANASIESGQPVKTQTRF